MLEELSPIEMKKMINNLEAENAKLKQKLVMLFNLANFCLEEDREREVHCNHLNMNEMI
jgi:hypothetical protein